MPYTFRDPVRIDTIIKLSYYKYSVQLDHPSPSSLNAQLQFIPMSDDMPPYTVIPVNIRDKHLSFFITTPRPSRAIPSNRFKLQLHVTGHDNNPSIILTAGNIPWTADTIISAGDISTPQPGKPEPLIQMDVPNFYTRLVKTLVPGILKCTLSHNTIFESPGTTYSTQVTPPQQFSRMPVIHDSVGAFSVVFYVIYDTSLPSIPCIASACIIRSENKHDKPGRSISIPLGNIPIHESTKFTFTPPDLSIYTQLPVVESITFTDDPDIPDAILITIKHTPLQLLTDGEFVIRLSRTSRPHTAPITNFTSHTYFTASKLPTPDSFNPPILVSSTARRDNSYQRESAPREYRDIHIDTSKPFRPRKPPQNPVLRAIHTSIIRRLCASYK